VLPSRVWNVELKCVGQLNSRVCDCRVLAALQARHALSSLHIAPVFRRSLAAEPVRDFYFLEKCVVDAALLLLNTGCVEYWMR
jgi:hypothetical protein